MKYRNIKTGAVIDIDSVLKGANWEPVKAEAVEKVPEKKSAKKGTKK